MTSIEENNSEEWIGHSPKKKLPGNVSGDNLQMAPSLDDDEDEEGSSGSDSEVVELDDEDDDDESDSEYEEVEVDDDDDETEGIDNEEDETDDDDDASEFEPLPPPIEIPDALKPKNMRGAEHSKKKKKGLYDGSSSDDDSNDTSDFDESDLETPPAKKATSKPSVVDDDDSDEETSISSVSEVQKKPPVKVAKPAPKPAPKKKEEAPVKKVAAKPPPTEDSDSEASDDGAKGTKSRKGRWAANSDDEGAVGGLSPAAKAMRPGAVRGASFDSDDAVAEKLRKSVDEPRRGKKPVVETVTKSIDDEVDEAMDHGHRVDRFRGESMVDHKGKISIEKKATPPPPPPVPEKEPSMRDLTASPTPSPGGSKSDSMNHNSRSNASGRSLVGDFADSSSNLNNSARWKPPKKVETETEPKQEQYKGRVWSPPKKKEKKIKNDKKDASDEDDDPNGEYYPLEDMRKMKIPDLDYKNREKYLNAKDFKEAFGVKRDEFFAWPKWKQTKAKRTAKLF
uniref:HP domain-containing protein n=1 Tax=Entomoneis paludosa TaxID=265537 RepID=A0A7S2Y8B1_9STRA|mmetsp:Transcript_22207/g.46299  ORF Transcript_22207/g.46299 Transcript_22207/m.46299 type:complete len:509 (+) Transcript_22207:421-1947(+)